MSETKDDGGPAFPREDYQLERAPGQSGMSLRDYFAAAALTGFASQSFSMFGDTTPTYVSGVAKFAYEIADAMLAARKAKT